MKTAPVFIVLLSIWALPSVSQIRQLTVVNTIRTTVTFEGNFALPTFCDEKGRAYVMLRQRGGMEMVGPIFRISEKGLVEAEFDITGSLGNTFAVRPDGGIAASHLDGKTKVIDNFGPDGTREVETRLEEPPIPFFPTQIAVFPSGGILVAGPRYQPRDQASTAVYDPEGRLVKQLDLDRDAEVEHQIRTGDNQSAGAPQGDQIGRSVAITGDDGYVYFMRSTSTPTVYVISSAGEVVRKIVVQGPTGAAGPHFGMRVVKNRLVVEFYRECSGNSCKGKVFAVLDATTGKRLADYALEVSGGPMACYAPDPDRFFTLHGFPQGNGIALDESIQK